MGRRRSLLGSGTTRYAKCYIAARQSRSVGSGDGAVEALVLSVCPHVSGPGAGSRGGVVPNPRHCTKILPGGRGWNGSRALLTQGPLGGSARSIHEDELDNDSCLLRDLILKLLNQAHKHDLDNDPCSPMDLKMEPL